MRSLPKLLTAALLASMLTFQSASAQEDAVPQENVLAYLEQLISWQRDAVALEASASTARELIFQDTLRQNSLRVLQSGFKFARAEASHEPAADAPVEVAEEEQTPAQRLKVRLNETTDRISQINTRLGQLDALLAKSHSAAKQPLLTEQNNLRDELKLAEAREELLQNVTANVNASASGEAKGFLGKINNLARAIPELNAPAPKDAKEASKAAMAAAPTTTPSAAPNTRSPTSILSLTSDLFDLTRKQRALDDFMFETAKLDATSQELIQMLRRAMEQATAPDGEGAKMTIDQKVSEYKRIGSDLMPLGDATLWVGISKRNVEDWQNLLAEQVQTVVRSLAIHLGILAVTLAIPLIIASIVKRAIKRYVIDPKRERQAQNARRVIVGLVVLFIILQNFISDFSSFATFAGFMTAGLAVALQSVLLSLVAHFFFYGRYGVRAGDRVTVGGVTGDILQIGMMRFYMRELKKKGEDDVLQPTGKVVAFPNSILFQPAAFYKYV